MTFDIPYGQPLDARSHGYINRTREFTEYGSSFGICCQIWTRPNNCGTVKDIRWNKAIVNLVRVWYDSGLSPLEIFL